MTLSDLDNLAPPEEPQVLTEILRECIESNPENLFKKEHIENYPATNFGKIMERNFSRI